MLEVKVEIKFPKAAKTFTVIVETTGEITLQYMVDLVNRAVKDAIESQVIFKDGIAQPKAGNV